MPTYLSPGVYVEEIPSASAPIAGVGTSTAGLIGIISLPVNFNVANGEIKVGDEGTLVVNGKQGQKSYDLPVPKDLEGLDYNIVTGADKSKFMVAGREDKNATLTSANGKLSVTLSQPISDGDRITGYYTLKVTFPLKVGDTDKVGDDTTKQEIGTATAGGENKIFPLFISKKLKGFKVALDMSAPHKFYNDGVEDSGAKPTEENGILSVELSSSLPDAKKITGYYTLKVISPPKVGDTVEVGNATTKQEIGTATAGGENKIFPLFIPESLKGFKVALDKSAPHKFYNDGAEDSGAKPTEKNGLLSVELSSSLPDAKKITGYYTLEIKQVPAIYAFAYQLRATLDNKYVVVREQVKGEKVGKVKDAVQADAKYHLPLSQYPVLTESGQYTISPNTDSAVLVNLDRKRSVVEYSSKPSETGDITVDYYPVYQSVAAAEVVLCTNFNEFKQSFGGFSNNADQNRLAHAVYGFFNNGGTRCYVTWISSSTSIDQALQKFAAIDEIAIVAAPGITTKTEQTAIAEHCTQMGDRVAVLDSPETVETSSKLDLTQLDPKGVSSVLPGNSKYAAYYFPWIQVSDPASNDKIYVPPSGHIAGIYARVDAQRGVHKAPANETVFGAVGLKYGISRPKQDGLNPQGINCIRALNGNIQVWGARTLGGDDNLDFKYISTRRLFNYLRKSIDEGTQWVVFEPNSPELWAKIRLNITAFLTMVWRTGALFGTTPDQAFFVKCDAENNPPDLREQGQVVTEIGVAIVKPAEFVIFRVSQWAGGGGN